jgi:hypothetical protein
MVMSGLYGHLLYQHRQKSYLTVIKAKLDPRVIAQTMVETQPIRLSCPYISEMKAITASSAQGTSGHGQIRKGKMVNAGYAIHPDLAKVVGDWKFPQ